jgi:polyisoprenoid-binding protein YceI
LSKDQIGRILPEHRDPRGDDFLRLSCFVEIHAMKIFVSVALALLLPGFVHAAEVPLDSKQSTLKFTGHAFLHDFNGEAKEFGGSAQVDAQKPELVVSARIDITAAKMTTFESTRDKNMFEWLHVEANPAIGFELTRVVSMDGKAATATRDHPAKFVVTGNFILNQVAKPLQTEATGWREGTRLIVTGTTTVDTADHGLPIIQAFFMEVDKHVDISFRLVFDLPPNLQIPAKP